MRPESAAGPYLRVATLVASPSSGRFRHAINAGDRAAAAMLRTRGLRPVRHFWHMQIDLVQPPEPGRSPEGIQVGAVEVPDDLVAVHSVLDEAFADDWGYHPEPFDRWAEEGRGWVDEVGVLPSHRGRGIGAALLRRSFATFARRGLRRVLLNVDSENPTGATALYERVGMRAVKQWDLWERSPGGHP
jgi:mycothiol synthase